MGQQSVLIREAEESMQQGDLDGAIEKFEAAKRGAEPPSALFPKMAQACALRGRYLTVLSLYLEWAECSLSRDEIEQAEEAVEFALRLRPDSTQANAMKAAVLRQRGEKESLIEHLVELSYLHLEKGTGEESIPLLEEAMKLAPENLDLPLKLAETYVSVGQIQMAVTGYRRCINLCLDAGEVIRTLEPLRRLKMLRPDDPAVLLELGRACLDVGYLQEAEDQFRGVLKIELENEDALLCLATACEQQGSFRSGILAVNKVLQLNPDSPVALQRMGDLQRAIGNSPKAVEAYQKAAQCYLEDGNKEAAGQAFQSMLWMNPDDAAALNGLHSLGIEARPEEPDMPEAEPVAAHEVVEVAKEPIVEPEPVVEEPVPQPQAKIEKPKKSSRPALIPKNQLQPKSQLKPAFKRTSGTSSGKRKLRHGLNLKNEESGEKPVLRRRPSPVAEIVIESEVKVDPVVVEEPEIRVELVAEEPKLEREPLIEAPEVSIEPAEPEADELFPEEDGVLDGPLFPDEETSPEAPKVERVVQEEEPECDDDPYKKLFEEPMLESDLVAEEQEAAEPELSLFDWPLEDPELSIDDDLPWEEALFPPSVEEAIVDEAPVIEDVPIVEEAKAPETNIDEEHVEEVALELFEGVELLPEPEENSEAIDPDVLFPEFDASFADWELAEPITTDAFEGLKESEWSKEEPLAVEPEESPTDVVEPAATSIEESKPEPDEPWFEPVEEVVLPPESELDLAEEPEDVPISEPELSLNEPLPVDLLPLPVEDESTGNVEPLPVEELKIPTEESESETFEELRAAVVSELAEENEPTDLSSLLAQTMPVSPEPVAEIEPEEVVEELPLPEPELSEEPVPVSEPKPADAGEAVTQLREIQSVRPSDEEATMQLADHCLRFGLLEEALTHYRTLYRVNPGSMEVGQRLIKAALWAEDYPTVMETLLKVARLQFDKGDLTGCQDRLGDLLSLAPDHKEARQLMVEVFLASNQEKLAAWHLGQMVERWAADGEWEHATLALQKLATVAPSENVQERLAELYLKQERESEALDILRELRVQLTAREELDKATELARRILISEAHKPSDRQQLIELLEKQDLESEAAQEKLLLAREYRTEGRLPEATELLRNLSDSDTFEGEHLLVEIYLESGQLTLAEQHAESLAVRFLETKSYHEAIKLFEAWVKAEPTNAKARERLAQFYQLGGDLEGAKLEWLLVTQTHETHGDIARATRSLERALELDPEQWDWRLKLARLRWESHADPQGALRELRLLFAHDAELVEATELFTSILMEQNQMAELGQVLTQLQGSDLGSRLCTETMDSLRNRMVEQQDNMELQFAWGELCYGLGSWDLAIEQFQKLRRLPEYRLRSFRMLGLCFAKKPGINMTELAISQFKKGLNIPDQSEPERARLRVDMARLLIKKGRNQEAAEQLHQARAWYVDTGEIDRLLASL